MEILYANESFPPQYDGVSVCVLNYANIINEKYGKSCILVPADAERRQEDFSFELLQCPSAKMTIANQYKVCLPMPTKLKNEIDKMPLNIVHSHSPFITGILAMRIARQKNIPHISTFHSKYKDDVNLRLKSNMELPGEMVAKYTASFYNKCDYVWTVSHSTADTLREYGYKGEVTVMPNGCDMPETLRDATQRKELAEKFGTDPTIPFFLFVGRLTYLKNIDLIVKSLSILKKQGKKFFMLFVGSGEDEDKLKELVKEFNLEDEVKFIGKVTDRDELRKIYSSCDLFVFPSVYDNAPLVIREAAACGMASLLIKGSNSSEGITDKVNGILTNESVEGIALALNEAITNMDLFSIGKNARNTIYVTWDEVLDTAAEEYQRVLKDFNIKKPVKRFVSAPIYDIDLTSDFDVAIPEKKMKSKKNISKSS